MLKHPDIAIDTMPTMKGVVHIETGGIEKGTTHGIRIATAMENHTDHATVGNMIESAGGKMAENETTATAKGRNARLEEVREEETRQTWTGKIHVMQLSTKAV